MIKTLIIENEYIDIECDIKEGSQGLPCGAPNPSSATECRIYSTDFNSCCLYKDESNKYCLWLGYQGNRGEVMPNVRC